jgi:hypothetical protein
MFREQKLPSPAARSEADEPVARPPRIRITPENWRARKRIARKPADHEA